MIIDLPFPPKDLSPNARVHWRTLARAKKQYRAACGFTAMAAYRKTDVVIAEGDRLRLDLTFYPPHPRNYDRDNLVARMKAGIDGIADALSVDDNVFDLGNVTVGPKVAGGSVRVQITPVTATPETT